MKLQTANELIKCITEIFTNPEYYQIKHSLCDNEGGYCFFGAKLKCDGLEIDDENRSRYFRIPYENNIQGSFRLYLQYLYPDLTDIDIHKITTWNDNGIGYEKICDYILKELVND